MCAEMCCAAATIEHTEKCLLCWLDLRSACESSVNGNDSRGYFISPLFFLASQVVKCNCYFPTHHLLICGNLKQTVGIHGLISVRLLRQSLRALEKWSFVGRFEETSISSAHNFKERNEKCSNQERCTETLAENSHWPMCPIQIHHLRGSCTEQTALLANDKKALFGLPFFFLSHFLKKISINHVYATFKTFHWNSVN